MFTSTVVSVLRDILSRNIEPERLQAYLPFHTVIRHGENYNHITNASIFTVETRDHYIHEGGALCGRRRQHMTDAYGEPTCPGCIAKAKNIVIRHLLYNE